MKRRKCLSVGDLEGAAAAEVALLVAVLDAQFGQAQVDADQGLITVQVIWAADLLLFCRKVRQRCPDCEPGRVFLKTVLWGGLALTHSLEHVLVCAGG